jgi:hypothetical protein
MGGSYLGTLVGFVRDICRVDVTWWVACSVMCLEDVPGKMQLGLLPPLAQTPPIVATASVNNIARRLLFKQDSTTTSNLCLHVQLVSVWEL